MAVGDGPAVDRRSPGSTSDVVLVRNASRAAAPRPPRTAARPPRCPSRARQLEHDLPRDAAQDLGPERVRHEPAFAVDDVGVRARALGDHARPHRRARPRGTRPPPPACRASTLASRLTDLMSQRFQRSSGSVTTATPSASSSGLGERARGARSRSATAARPLGNRWLRGATPRLDLHIDRGVRQSVAAQHLARIAAQGRARRRHGDRQRGQRAVAAGRDAGRGRAAARRSALTTS